MKKFLLVLMAVVAFSSVAVAYNPHAAPEAVGGKIDANKQGANLAKPEAVGEKVDANKQGANLAKESERANNMLQKADNETGMGAAYSGSSGTAKK